VAAVLRDRPFLPVVALAVSLPSAHCGGSTPPPQAPAPVDAPAPAAASAEPPPAAAAPAQDPSGGLPTACAKAGADLCVPPWSFTERLCTKPHQEVALALFGKKSPFTRLYLKARLDELSFDEEVIALRFHEQPKGGMVVGSGLGTYDVLRWDGSCSTGVEAEVFTRARPPKPRAAHVQWHRIGEVTQNALIASSDSVKRAHAKRGKECKGAMTGDVSASCEKADAALVDAIVESVRSGQDLPPPDVP
jgi:hypothetical protein